MIQWLRSHLPVSRKEYDSVLDENAGVKALFDASEKANDILLIHIDEQRAKIEELTKELENKKCESERNFFIAKRLDQYPYMAEMSQVVDAIKCPKPRYDICNLDYPTYSKTDVYELRISFEDINFCLIPSEGVIDNDNNLNQYVIDAMVHDISEHYTQSFSDYVRDLLEQFYLSKNRKMKGIY